MPSSGLLSPLAIQILHQTGTEYKWYLEKCRKCVRLTGIGIGSTRMRRIARFWEKSQKSPVFAFFRKLAGRYSWAVLLSNADARGARSTAAPVTRACSVLQVRMAITPVFSAFSAKTRSFAKSGVLARFRLFCLFRQKCGFLRNSRFLRLFRSFGKKAAFLCIFAIIRKYANVTLFLPCYRAWLAHDSNPAIE